MIEKINLIIGPEKGASPHLTMATKYQWYNYRGQVNAKLGLLNSDEKVILPSENEINCAYTRSYFSCWGL
jgi:hypothetical protein